MRYDVVKAEAYRAELLHRQAEDAERLALHAEFHAERLADLAATGPTKGLRAAAAAVLEHPDHHPARRRHLRHLAARKHRHAGHSAVDVVKIRRRELEALVFNAEAYHVALAAEIEELAGERRPTDAERERLVQAKADLRVEEHRIRFAKRLLLELRDSS